MKNLTLIFVLFIGLVSNAQTTFKFTTAKSTEIATALKNTTYVVLNVSKPDEKVNISYEKINNEEVVDQADKGKSEFDGDENEYNKFMREAIEKVWKITKFEFITQEKFDQIWQDTDKNFIYTTIQKEKDGEAKYTTLNLVFAIGGKAPKQDKLKRISGIQYYYGNLDADFHLWKIPGLIKFLQHHAEYASGNAGLTGEEGQAKIVDHYKENNSKISRDFRLMIYQSDLTSKVYNREAIEAIYKGDFEITDDPSLITEAILKGENVAWFHKIAPEGSLVDKNSGDKYGVTIKYIFSAIDGEMLYSYEDPIAKKNPEGINAQDFKALKSK